MATLNLTREYSTKTTLKAQPRVKGDELFPELARITCRVCSKEESVGIDHIALLCFDCLSDLGATERRVSGEYADAMAAFFQASEALVGASDDWYAKTEAARADVEPAVFARAWDRARTGEHAAIVAMRDWMDECAEMMQRAEQRYLDAAPELAAAREARGELGDV